MSSVILTRKKIEDKNMAGKNRILSYVVFPLERGLIT